MKYIILLFAFLLFSCASVSRNMWLNRFEVCCVVEQSLERNKNEVEMKEGYFEDDYLKMKAEFDVMDGFKFNFMNKCGVNSYINWDRAFYLDEYAKLHSLTLSEVSFLNEKNKPNISILPPFIEIDVNVIPSDYIYRKDNMWLKKTIFDFSLHPQKYLFKKISVNFFYLCGDIGMKYSLSFLVNKRYPKNNDFVE